MLSPWNSYQSLIEASRIVWFAIFKNRCHHSSFNGYSKYQAVESSSPDYRTMSTTSREKRLERSIWIGVFAQSAVKSTAASFSFAPSRFSQHGISRIHKKKIYRHYVKKDNRASMIQNFINVVIYEIYFLFYPNSINSCLIKLGIFR